MLRTAETPSVLLADIAREIARVRDPRARHWIVTPGRGRSEHILHGWASLSGIASHSQELELRTLLDQISAGTRMRFDFDALRLAIAGSLHELAETCTLPLPKDIPLAPVTASVLSWATLLARAIDDTLQCRTPDAAWPPDSFLARLVQLPPVAGALESHPGLLSESAFERAALQWIASWNRKGGVPYLWIQLDAGLPGLLLQRLLQTLRFFEEHQIPERIRLFAITPSFEYWGDQLTRSRNRRSGFPSGESERHPGGLLWALGGCSRDFQSQISEHLLAEGPGETALSSAPCPDSLLGWLQNSCRQSAPPNVPHLLEAHDCSLTVHSAHTRLREMEICRDRILQAREELVNLRDEEILVLLANPKEQAACVEAAFNGAAEVRIPFRLSGFGQTIPSPFATALELLVEKLGGRLTLPDLQTLLDHPLIARRFHIQKEAGESKTVLGWLRDAGFRWGIDPEHRHAEQDLKEHRWSLSWALQRLAIGGIISEPDRNEPLVYGGQDQATVPLERAAGLSVQLLANVACFLETLHALRPVWVPGVHRPLGEWIQHTTALVEACLLAEEPADCAHSSTLRNSILPMLAEAEACDLELETGGFIRLLQDKLARLNESSSRGGGGIRVGDLRQMAGVPARLILVTGLDNDSFPISEDQPAWHPLCREKREGDPSAREADRHALLLAILSARERLVFSFCGGSDEDQKERPPSTALADVLNAIDSIAKTREPGPAHAAIVHRHPLNGCSPRAFRRNTSPNAVGKNPADYTAAKHIASRAKRPVFQGPWSLVLPAETDVRPTLADLHLLLKDPVRIFLQRLGVHAPREQEEPDGSDLVELDELQKWSIRDELLLARLEGGDQEGVLRRLSVSGRVPRGALGEAILADLGDGTNSGLTFTPSERMAQSCRVFVSSAEGTFTPFWLEGSPRAGWYRKPGDPSCYYFSVSKLKDSEMKRLPPFLLDALAIAASEPGEEAASGPSGASVCASRATGHFLDNQIVLPGLTPERARALLTPLVELYQLARQIPLPFWPDASAAGLAHFEKAGGDPAHIPDALEAARQRWAHGKFTMPGSAESKHAATRLAFRGLEDPMTWHPGLEARFLGEAGEMLAWRVARYLQRWMTGVIPATPSKAAKQKKS